MSRIIQPTRGPRGAQRPTETVGGASISGAKISAAGAAGHVAPRRQRQKSLQTRQVVARAWRPALRTNCTARRAFRPGLTQQGTRERPAEKPGCVLWALRAAFSFPLSSSDARTRTRAAHALRRHFEAIRWATSPAVCRPPATDRRLCPSKSTSIGHHRLLSRVACPQIRLSACRLVPA